MKIILKNADFSANNIGQIEIPIIWELETIAYLSAIQTAAATFSYSQNIAINTFFRELKLLNIYSKIEYLFLPIFSNINYADGWVNLINPSFNLNYPSSGYGTFDNNGVTPSLGWQSSIIKKIGDMHLGFYNTTYQSDAAISTSSLGMLNANYPRVGRRTATGNAGFFFSSTASTYVGTKIYDNGFIVGSSSSTNSLINVADDEGTTLIKTGVTISNTTQYNVIFGGSNANSASYAATYAHSLFTIGNYLTTDEGVAYGQSIVKLMTAFGLPS